MVDGLRTLLAIGIGVGAAQGIIHGVPKLASRYNVNENTVMCVSLIISVPTVAIVWWVLTRLGIF